MTVAELLALLESADPAAQVLAVPEGATGDPAAYAIHQAQVWGFDDFRYTGVPGRPGDFVFQLGEPLDFVEEPRTVVRR